MCLHISFNICRTSNTCIDIKNYVATCNFLSGHFVALICIYWHIWHCFEWTPCIVAHLFCTDSDQICFMASLWPFLTDEPYLAGKIIICDKILTMKVLTLI